jgi:tetratricopeptide (TPR) repeat protein
MNKIQRRIFLFCLIILWKIISDNCFIFIRKNNPDIFQNLSEALANMGEFKKAERVYQEALELFPHSSPLKFGYSLLSLKLGNFQEGWKYYEERWHDPLKQEKFKHYNPYFTNIVDGEQFRGRSVLILSEQGGGDVVMFLSTLEELKNYTTNITILTFDRLIKLLSNSFPDCQFLPIENYDPQIVANYDIFIPCGRLPTLFRRERRDFNGQPYLSASREAVSRFSEHLQQQRGKIKIGISWRGGTVDTRTRHRSLTISELQPLLSLPNCHFVSLQYSLTETEQQELGLKQYDNLTIFDGNITNDFDDLAGLIANLDFVVTVQNTNVHIAGSLGKKCFVMLPMSPEWRYGASGSTMAWYGSVELYRQNQSGNWDAVLHEVVKRVENYCNELKVESGNVADA